jgi:hypothetical protein
MSTPMIGCAQRDSEDAQPDVIPSDVWVRDHVDEISRLSGAIDDIVSAVKGNDVRLLGDGPAQCASTAATLAASAATNGATESGADLDAVAGLCEWLTGPASVHDVGGVVQTLDPLFVAVGQISPLLDLIVDVT